MNEQDMLRQLARAAGQQAPPLVDVTDWVLGDLAVARRRRVEPVLKWFAAAAAAAAVVVTGVAAGAWVQWQDPLADLFRATAVIP
jgi:hypothetical protein